MSGGLSAAIDVRRGAFRLTIDLNIQPGMTVALLGPNGSGKSTAVAALSGLLPVDAGQITLADQVLDAPAANVYVIPEDRKIGIVFQDYLLFPHMTVLDNVAFGLRSRGVGKEEAGARAMTWIERLDLGGLEKRKPPGLSGGQAQRVALARALVIEPDLLLLDEPLAALDVTTRGGLRRVLAQHLSVFPGPRLLITHDPTEAFLLADEIHVIEEGSITQTGEPDDIRLRPKTAYAADLAGANLMTGRASAGVVAVDGHDLAVADADVEGEVLVRIRPNAVAVYRQRPEGSPRNTWRTTIEVMERLGDRTRIQTGEPLPLTVEVTDEATAELGLTAGADVWLAIKATEIGIEPSGG